VGDHHEIAVEGEIFALDDHRLYTLVEGVEAAYK
jgi:hypothetical protein